MPQLLPGVDKEVSHKLENIFKKKGIKVSTNTDAASLDFNNYELVLLSIGHIPNTENLGLKEVGIDLERGAVKVDENLRTNIKNIFGAGDCTGQVLLAHFAAYQGRIAAQNITHPEKLVKCDNRVVPSCIFTDPEISCVGINEEDALNSGLEIKVKKFDFLASGMARIIDETEGFIKIIFDLKTEIILGASIIGPSATELIGIVSLAITNNLKASQLRDTIFAHPTLSESLHEALK